MDMPVAAMMEAEPAAPADPTADVLRAASAVAAVPTRDLITTLSAEAATPVPAVDAADAPPSAPSAAESASPPRDQDAGAQAAIGAPVEDYAAVSANAAVVAAAAFATAGSVAQSEHGVKRAASPAIGLVHEIQSELSLPIGRVKRVIKSDDDIKQIKPEAAALITKATELFLGYFVQEAFRFTQTRKRKMLQYNDLANAVSQNPEGPLEFLQDIVPAKRQVLDEETVTAIIAAEKAAKPALSTEAVQAKSNSENTNADASQEARGEDGGSAQHEGSKEFVVQDGQGNGGGDDDDGSRDGF